MRLTLLCVGALVAQSTLVSCKKKEEATNKVAAPMKAVTGAPVMGEIPVTTSSAEARAAFEQGRTFLENARFAEAGAPLTKAVAADPKFALALAYLALATRGPDGEKVSDRALAASAGLPDAERALVELLAAQKKGETAKAKELRAKLAALAPRDWRAHAQVGNEAFGRQAWPEAIAALRRATELNPKAGEPYNQLAYAHAFQGQFDTAITAVKKYAELRPGEANAQDSLAEIQLMAGRYGEAAAAFERAAELAPKFWIALEGAAVARFLEGKFDEGRAALTKARGLDISLRNKLWLDLDVAKSFQAEGKMEEARRGLAALEREAEAKNETVRFAWVPWHEALLELEAGNAEKALAKLQAGETRASKLKLSKLQQRDLLVRGNLLRAAAQAKLGKAADAAASAAAVEARVRQEPESSFLASLVAQAKGHAEVAKGDHRAALTHFARCVPEDAPCQRERARAQEKAGDPEGAKATRAAIAKKAQRSLAYVLALRP